MVITPEQWRLQTWKNGRGATMEVLRFPDVDDYDLRISVADVTESGPFSTFPGYRRWTMQLDGEPVVLDINGVTTPLSTTRFVELDGAWPIEATVAGPARLLNVIAKSGVRVGVGDAANIDIAFALADPSLADTALVESAPAGELLLPRWHTWVFDAPSRVSGNVAWVRRPR